MIPNTTASEKRDKALIAFTLLTGARGSAIAPMKIEHIDIKMGMVYQDASGVKTKYSKSFTRYFSPVGDEVYRIVAEWVDYLKRARFLSNLREPP
ncbi:MAG: integrase [Cellvibrionaceae bacterium]|jgi:integrase